MSLKHKLKLLSHYFFTGRFRELYNMFWIYPLWWNHKTAAFLLNRLFPAIGIDLFPPFLEIEHTTVCPFRCKICVPEDSVVLCQNPKSIQNVDTNDFVLDKNGKIQRVLEIFENNYEGGLIECKAEGVLPFSLTPEHKVLVAKKQWIDTPRQSRRYKYHNNFEFIEAKNLNKNYALVFPKLKQSKEYCEEFPLSNDLLKFLGIYAAEGCVVTSSRKKNKKIIGNHGIISLYFGKHEYKLVNETCRLIKSVFNKNANVQETRTSMNIIFHSVKIANWLRKFGVHATEKKIPEFIMFLEDKNLIKSFIDGFIEGDGYVNPKYIQLTTSSKVLGLQLQKLLSKIDIFARLYVNKRKGESFIEGRKVYINDLYNLRITDKDFFKFFNIEKQSRRQYYGETDDYFLLPIRSINEVKYKGRVYNLETPDKTFELNNICVHNCEHSYWKEQSKNMPFEQFKHIFDQFGKLKWIGLTGIGSSYLNPDFHKIVRYCKSKGTVVELMDHFATFKNDEQIKELLEIGPDFQFVSIYGAKKKTSEAVCIGSNYDSVIKNVKTFVRLKKEMKKQFPILNFHFIITSYSKGELLEFLDFVHSLDTEVGEVLVTPMLHDFKEAKNYAVRIDKEYVEKAQEKAKQYKIPMTINWAAQQDASGSSSKPPFSCCKEYIMPFVFVTGEVTPCCGQNEANERDWQKKLSFGNTLKEHFRKIWYSPRYKTMRKLLRKDKCPAECKLCPAYNVRTCH